MSCVSFWALKSYAQKQVFGCHSGSMLAKYGMSNCKPISVLLDQNVKLSAHDGKELEDPTMYRRIVGSLIYLTISRPDLNYTVGLESQFM